MTAVLAYLGASDIRIAGRLKGWRPPRWLRLMMVWATRLGNGWFSLGAALALYCAADPDHRALAAATVAVGAGNIAVIVLKRRFRRGRPAEFSTELFGVPCADAMAFDRFSFPSGHAVNAFTVATVVALAAPPLAPAVIVLASAVAASRVVLGHHFTSDVLVGALLGVSIGWMSFRFLVG